MKKRLLKCTAFLALVFVMLLTLIPTTLSAGAQTAQTQGRKPIPLLVIKVSYDANKNGKNDFEDPKSERLFTRQSSEYYGEQWCTSPDKYWADMLFSDDSGSLKAYYKEISNGKFWFYPAEENSGEVNDGIIDVVVPYPHPVAVDAGKNTAENETSTRASLKEAGKYIDFSKYDKNGNYVIEHDELAIIFVNGGGGPGYEEKGFRTRGHYCPKKTPTTVNGYSVGASYVRLDEGSETFKTVGTVAHELGHFLGAPDLYDTTDTNTWNYVGYSSLMAYGNYADYGGKRRGQNPSYMDPYSLIACGLQTSQLVVKDGDYVLYSRGSEEGKYNILRVNTASPKEYYLIENRYHEEGSTSFDPIGSKNMAVLIWHIDESVTERAGFAPVHSNSGREPGVVLMGPKGLTAGEYDDVYSFRRSEGVNDAESYTFESEATKYVFPLSGRSHTMITKDEGLGNAIKITVNSPAGDEMTVSITRNDKPAPEFNAKLSGTTTSSISFSGQVTEVFNGDVTEAKAIISTQENPTEENGTSKTVVPGKDGKFDLVLDGLKENTKYYIRISVTGKNGTREKLFTVYTDFEKKQNTDFYYLNLYKGLTSANRANKVKIKPGELFVQSFPMDKLGYDFCGWYLDPEYKERYDMGFTQTVCKDISLYAKWAKKGTTASLKLVGAESKYKLFACETGDSFDAPVPAEKAGYKFVGWYSDEELTLPYDFGQTVDEAGEITIYAKWEEDESYKPETTTTQPPVTEATTPAATTTSVATTTPATTTTGGSTTAAGGEGGCGSAMGAGAAVALIGAVGLALLAGRKKKE